jgi:hypothetical protein
MGFIQIIELDVNYRAASIGPMHALKVLWAGRCIVEWAASSIIEIRGYSRHPLGYYYCTLKYPHDM